MTLLNNIISSIIYYQWYVFICHYFHVFIFFKVFFPDFVLYTPSLIFFLSSWLICSNLFSINCKRFFACSIVEHVEVFLVELGVFIYSHFSTYLCIIRKYSAHAVSSFHLYLLSLWWKVSRLILFLVLHLILHLAHLTSFHLVSFVENMVMTILIVGIIWFLRENINRSIYF